MLLIMSVFLLRYRGIPSGSLGFQRNHFVDPMRVTSEQNNVKEDSTSVVSSLLLTYS